MAVVPLPHPDSTVPREERPVLADPGGGGPLRPIQLDMAGTFSLSEPTIDPQGASGQQLVAKGAGLRSSWAPKAPNTPQAPKAPKGNFCPLCTPALPLNPTLTLMPTPTLSLVLPLPLPLPLPLICALFHGTACGKWLNSRVAVPVLACKIKGPETRREGGE